MNGISFITDEIGNKKQIVIDLSQHEATLKKFFKKTDVDAGGTAAITPRKLRVTEDGKLTPYVIDQEVAASRAESKARIEALEKQVADYEEKVEELDDKIEAYEDKVEEYEKEKTAKEDEENKKEASHVAESGKKVEATTDKGEKKEQVKIILTKAESLLGAKHVLGKLGPDEIDCSGLSTVSFKAAGIALPRTSRAQAEVGKPVEIKEKLKPGDLVFFASGKPGRLNHVGIVHDVPSPSNIKFIHTSTSRGVMISSLSTGFWSKCYLKGRRVV